MLQLLSATSLLRRTRCETRCQPECSGAECVATTMRRGNLNQLQKAATAFRKGRNIGMRTMRVGLGKHFKPAPVLTRQTQAIFESVPTSAEEAATRNRDELWSQINHVIKEEKRLRAERFEPLAVKLCKLSAHQADQRRVKWPKKF